MHVLGRSDASRHGRRRILGPGADPVTGQSARWGLTRVEAPSLGRPGATRSPAVTRTVSRALAPWRCSGVGVMGASRSLHIKASPYCSCNKGGSRLSLMKPQKTRDVLRYLKSIGWVRLRGGQGSHEIWGLPDGSIRAVIPAGHREISAGVLMQLKRAGVDVPTQWQ